MHEKDQKAETVSKYIEVASWNTKIGACYRFYTWFSNRNSWCFVLCMWSDGWSHLFRPAKFTLWALLRSYAPVRRMGTHFSMVIFYGKCSLKPMEKAHGKIWKIWLIDMENVPFCHGGTQWYPQFSSSHGWVMDDHDWMIWKPWWLGDPSWRNPYCQFFNSLLPRAGSLTSEVLHVFFGPLIHSAILSYTAPARSYIHAPSSAVVYQTLYFCN